MKSSAFSKLLLQKYLDWQKEEDGRRTVAQFAEYVGLGHKTISHALNGTRPPSLNTIKHLAKFFNEPEFYDAADYTRPEPLTQFIIHALPKAPEVEKRRIAQELAQYTTEQIPNGEDDRSNNH